jgi:hypothetical protein
MNYIEAKVKDLVDLYLKSTEEFSVTLQERTPGEVAYDNEVVAGLRKGLAIKKALKLGKEKYPDEALQWDDQTIQDIKTHYEYLRDQEGILAKVKRVSKTK